MMLYFLHQDIFIEEQSNKRRKGCHGWNEFSLPSLKKKTKKKPKTTTTKHTHTKQFLRTFKDSASVVYKIFWCTVAMHLNVSNYKII